MRPTFLLSLILLAAGIGCATLEKRPQTALLPKTPEMEKAFQEAEKLFLSRSYGPARKSYEAYIEKFTYNYFTPKAHYRLGEIALVGEKWRDAIPAYRESLRKGIFPEWGAKAVYQLAVSHYRLGDYPPVFKALDDLPEDAEASLRVRGASLRVRSAKKGNVPLEEVKGFLELAEGYSLLSPSEWQIGELTWVVSQREAADFIREWLASSKMGEEETRRLLKWFQGRSAAGYVLWKIAQSAHRRGDYQEAADRAEAFVTGYPKNEYVPEARRLLTELGKRGAEEAVRVGVILPLSGKLGVYGQSVLKGIECGAGIYSPCRGGSPLTLEIRDSHGDPQKAVEQIRELASFPDIAGIIGPLSQREAAAAAPVAEEQQISMIALSQKEGLPQQGEFVFRNFLTVADQVATVVKYACVEKGLKDFAILYPVGAGGEEYLTHFKKDLEECGGRLVGKAGHEGGDESLLGALRMLKHSDPRLGERPHFQALFFPDAYRMVEDLTVSLRFLGMQGILLLGGAGWDHPDLAKIDFEGFQIAFVNGFFAGTNDFMTRDFAASFRSAFGVDPTLLEAYAYDTLKLVDSVLQGRPSISRSEFRRELAHTKNFKGVTGNISFDDEGDARRRLFLLTVQAGAIQEIR